MLSIGQGVGKIFLKKIFNEYKNLDSLILNSMKHPLWEKIAVKTSYMISNTNVYWITKEMYENN